MVDAGILIIFKYFYMLAEGAGFILGVPLLSDLRNYWLEEYQFEIVLPIAISFYTFQVIAYIVDCYRGVVTEYTPLRKFFVFVLFFPQFIAGPILRTTDFIPQIDRPTPTVNRMLKGCMLLIQGTLKKVLIADRIGASIAPVWQNPSEYDASVIVLVIFGFTAQIYCDFSGYTDMARGLARLLGFKLPENFKGPYFARSMSELWTRWHITLSSWLRDYIYIPLGGSRNTESRTTINLLITMGLGGVWHGATWTMLIWGIYIGAILVIERQMRIHNIRILPEGAFFNYLRSVWVLVLFTFSGLFFAAPSFENAMIMVQRMVTAEQGLHLANAESVLVLSIFAYMFNALQYHEGWKQWLAERTHLMYILVAAGTFLTGLLVSLYGDVSGSFIYFQF